VAASRTQVTSASNAGMSTLPQDKSYRNKTQEGMRERGGSQRYVGKIFLSFQTNPNRTHDILVDQGQRIVQQPLYGGDP
jgi:hypothetical protein